MIKGKVSYMIILCIVLAISLGGNVFADSSLNSYNLNDIEEIDLLKLTLSDIENIQSNQPFIPLRTLNSNVGEHITQAYNNRGC